MKAVVALLAIASLGMIFGCSHSIHQVYVSSQDPGVLYSKSSEWVSVEAKDNVILSFALQTDYVQDAYRHLEQKCPGRIAQVTSEHFTSYFFLSYDQRLILRGLCVKA